MSRFNFKNSFWLFLIFINFSSCITLCQGEIARLDHSFIGCFGSARNRITLYKQIDVTFAKLETNGEVVQDTRVSEDQIKAFNSFVEGLKYLEDSDNCTTVETYILYTGNAIIKRIDGSCDWNGFSILKQTLFNQEQK